MEALAAATACLELLSASLKILDRARAAYDRTTKGLPDLDFFIGDVKTVKGIVELVEKEKELQQDTMFLAVNGVSGQATVLKNTLTKIEQDSKKDFKRFMAHFIDGTREKVKVESMRSNLNMAKSTLALAMLAARFGDMKLDDKEDTKEIVINGAEVNRINGLYKQNEDLKEGLWIAKLVKVRGKRDADGKHWRIQETDLDELEHPPPYYPPLQPGQVRVISDQQVAEFGGEVWTGPIGKDGGDDKSMTKVDEIISTRSWAAYGGSVSTGSMRPVDFRWKEEKRMEYALKHATMALTAQGGQAQVARSRTQHVQGAMAGQQPNFSVAKSDAKQAAATAPKCDTCYSTDCDCLN